MAEPEENKETAFVIDKADILTNFKVPVKKGRGRLDKAVTINPNNNTIIFTKAMLFELGMPTKIAISIAKGNVFLIADPTLEGINCYEVRKANEKSSIPNLVNNKDLVEDICLTLNRLKGKFDVILVFQMVINGNKVYRMLLKTNRN